MAANITLETYLENKENFAQQVASEGWTMIIQDYNNMTEFCYDSQRDVIIEQNTPSTFVK